MISNFPTPPSISLICTHKRGAGLALFCKKGNEIGLSVSAAVDCLNQFSSVPPASIALPLTGATAHFYRSEDKHFFFATCDGLTAENLADLYRFALASMSLNDHAVTTLGVVEGPGSFTGLRLGCAFANGLMMGHARELWAVGGLNPNEVRQARLSANVEPEDFFTGGVSAEQDDPYAALTAFVDVLAHLENWSRGVARKVSVIEPVYGRDPTPVIKLRQQQGSPLS